MKNRKEGIMVEISAAGVKGGAVGSSCWVPLAALGAGDIAEERGKSWALLRLMLAKNPAQEKSWTLHQALAFPSSISACHRDRQHRVKQRGSKSSCGKLFQRINISIISQPDWKHS